MGSIRKRNGRFQVRVGRERVHEVIKTFNSKKDATVSVAGLEAIINSGELDVAAS